MLKFRLFGSLVKEIFLEREPFSTLHITSSARRAKSMYVPALEGFTVYKVGGLQWLTFIPPPSKCQALC